ncbi:MAG: tetraacyldisaccharide 4'-kinase [Phycisphaerales bacterium]|nr:tetraacyldisaccharide 4'-kinase [Phycisphaerales bacterium]
MNSTRRQSFVQIISGQRRGAGAALVRGAARMAEPLYAGVMAIRNLLYDNGWKKSRALPAATISIGNITTGGTGKTPMVRWLAERLRSSGYSPAILMRGYRTGDSTISDEQLMLEDQLHRHPGPRVIVHAEADRVEGAGHVAAHQPVDVFILDDGFQHRRARRDFDLLLINAVEPFGYDHVLPRGLLREPRGGLRRADAIVLTRADQVSLDEIARIERQIRAQHCGAPIYRARHALVSVLDGKDSLPLQKLVDQPFFVFAGIGSPAALMQQLDDLGGNCRGQHWFADHHDYSYDDLEKLSRLALAQGAKVLLTTEKDWAKLRRMKLHALLLPIQRLAMAIRFAEDDEARLFDQILRVLPRLSVVKTPATPVSSPDQADSPPETSEGSHPA